MRVIYRCFVPECDDANAPDYDQPWVLHAVPSTHKGANVFQAAQCERFVVDQYAGDSTNNGTLAAILGEPNVNGTSNKTTASSAWGNTCPADRFTDEVATCDRWVFESGERTIVNDVRINAKWRCDSRFEFNTLLLLCVVVDNVSGESMEIGTHRNAPLCRNRCWIGCIWGAG